MCFLLGNSLHVFLGKARLPSGQNFRRCNFTWVLMVFSWRSYLKFCFLIFFFIYDIQILFQLNLKTVSSILLSAGFRCERKKGERKIMISRKLCIINREWKKNVSKLHHKILMNKLDQGSERLIYWELWIINNVFGKLFKEMEQ